MREKIRFGTDGWRGIIADDFTFENVRLVTQAICDYIKVRSSELGVQRGHRTPTSDLRTTNYELRTLVVGYDTRFLSDRFAREAACVAVANGIKVLLTEGFAPTPAVSYAVVDRKTDGAIMLTASHNPPRYNGLKFKAPYGGSATSEITKQIEGHLNQNFSASKASLAIDFEEAQRKGLVELFDPKPPYLAHVRKLLDTGSIKRAKVKVVVDPIYGSGQGYLSELLSELGCEVEEIRGRVDPCFGGVFPEPMPQHLGELCEAVVSQGYQVGLALDGDADRVSAIDADGSFVSSHQIFALLLEHLAKEKKWRGDVVKTVSTTSMIDLLADHFGLVLHETPIGFKYICERILSGDVLIGGEESGGIGIKGHIPERDGILIGALLVELIASSGKTLGEMVRELMERIGYFYYERLDIEVDASLREKLIKRLQESSPARISGASVERVNTSDGYKFYLNDKSWLMIRPSGTEAVVRIYAEASSKKRVQELIKEGQKIVQEVVSG